MSSSATRSRCAAGAADEAEGADRLGHDVAHPPARVEAGIGVLEDHLHPPALLGGGARLGEVGALEQHLAAGRRVEADHQPRHGGLAAAALADEREGGALRDAEMDAVHRAQDAPRLAREQALQRGAGHVEVAGEVRRLDHRASRQTWTGSPGA